MRQLDDLLKFVDSDLKMEMVQSELDKYRKQQEVKEKLKPKKVDSEILRKVEEIKKVMSETESKSITHLQRLLDEYNRDRKHKLLFLYETREENKIYFNIIQDETKTEEELRKIISDENGIVCTKFEIKDNILYTDDKPSKQIKRQGKTYRLQKI